MAEIDAALVSNAIKGQEAAIEDKLLEIEDLKVEGISNANVRIDLNIARALKRQHR